MIERIRSKLLLESFFFGVSKGRFRRVSFKPPRPEDAGLEDCALPLETILEAFSKAASVSLSRFSNTLHDVSEGEDEGSEVDQISNGGERLPVQELEEEENALKRMKK
jgi:hypothetical protein